MREAKQDEPIVKAEFVYRHEFMMISHNYLCAVCKDKSAVIDCQSGVLHPCWGCQSDYKLVKRGWIEKNLTGFNKMGLK